MVKVLSITSVLVWMISAIWWGFSNSRVDGELWVLATAIVNWFVTACSVGWYHWWRDVQDD